MEREESKKVYKGRYRDFICHLSSGGGSMSASRRVGGAVAEALAASPRQRMLARVGEAAALYESRWTLRALKRVDPGLYEAVEDQQSLFHEAVITGEDADIIEHGEAMVRGWQAAVRRMEQDNIQEDAALVGFDPATGMKVVISAQRAVEGRARDLYGDAAVFLTPDEIAAMFAGLQNIAKVKSLWPGAEVVGMNSRLIDRFADEPAGD